MSDKRIKSSVARVISRFEDLKTRVEQSYLESGDFRSLCEDYAVCERALEKWQASDLAIAAQRRREYKELLAELGEEIQDWLEQRYAHEQSNKRIGPGNPNTP
jgi:ribosomal protein L16 Arg81 hydroxylase